MRLRDHHRGRAVESLSRDSSCSQVPRARTIPNSTYRKERGRSGPRAGGEPARGAPHRGKDRAGDQAGVRGSRQRGPRGEPEGPPGGARPAALRHPSWRLQRPRIVGVPASCGGDRSAARLRACPRESGRHRAGVRKRRHGRRPRARVALERNEGGGARVRRVRLSGLLLRLHRRAAQGHGVRGAGGGAGAVQAGQGGGVRGEPRGGAGHHAAGGAGHGGGHGPGVQREGAPQPAAGYEGKPQGMGGTEGVVRAHGRAAWDV
mmetsp:Transcript_22105/g.48510  ORF Transcript_22105/g.48510 Transcript_22105/m.48510 type:complete len:262 (-) Transcript_22105:204-989(-)